MACGGSRPAGSAQHCGSVRPLAASRSFTRCGCVRTAPEERGSGQVGRAAGLMVRACGLRDDYVVWRSPERSRDNDAGGDCRGFRRKRHGCRRQTERAVDDGRRCPVAVIRGIELRGSAVEAELMQCVELKRGDACQQRAGQHHVQGESVRRNGCSNPSHFPDARPPDEQDKIPLSLLARGRSKRKQGAGSMSLTYMNNIASPEAGRLPYTGTA